MGHVDAGPDDVSAHSPPGSKSCVVSWEPCSCPEGPATDWPQWAVVSPGASPRTSCCRSLDACLEHAGKLDNAIPLSSSLKCARWGTSSSASTSSEFDGHSPSSSPSKSECYRTVLRDMDVAVSL